MRTIFGRWDLARKVVRTADPTKAGRHHEPGQGWADGPDGVPVRGLDGPGRCDGRAGRAGDPQGVAPPQIPAGRRRFLARRARRHGAGDPRPATAGESPDSPAVDRALRFLLQAPEGGHETYTLGLKAMALAYAPEKYGQALQSYANRLELSQLRTPNRAAFGSWTYQQQGNGMGFGDNSNSQYALLGLYAAAEAVLGSSRASSSCALRYWAGRPEPRRRLVLSFRRAQPPPASMTCAGVSSLIIACAPAIRVARAARR